MNCKLCWLITYRWNVNMLLFSKIYCHKYQDATSQSCMIFLIQNKYYVLSLSQHHITIEAGCVFLLIYTELKHSIYT